MQFDTDRIEIECEPTFDGEIEIDLDAKDVQRLRDGESIEATKSGLTIALVPPDKPKHGRPSKETNQEYLDRTWAEDPRRTTSGEWPSSVLI